MSSIDIEYVLHTCLDYDEFHIRPMNSRQWEISTVHQVSFQQRKGSDMESEWIDEAADGVRFQLGS